MTATLIMDRAEILKLLTGPSGLIDESPVEGEPPLATKVSLDLRIREIFAPDGAEGEAGSPSKPHSLLVLDQGLTAVITTQIIRLPQGISAIGFPPSTVSIQGLLTTNPGIIDAGYYGPLHLTVINMGRKPFPLRSGDRIMRLLLFRDAIIPGNAGPKKESQVDTDLIDRLSPDFLDFDRRAVKVAEDRVNKAELRIKGWQVGTTIVAAIGAFVLSNANFDKSLHDEIAGLKVQVSALQTEINPSPGAAALHS